MRWLICFVLMAGAAQAGAKSTPVATPTMFPNPGKYVGKISIKLESSTPGAVIHFTTDETEPTESSPVYTEEIMIRSTTKIRAIATVAGHLPSEEIQGDYQIENFGRFAIGRSGVG